MFGIDETLERRRGEQIEAKGIYRDPVRSSRSHLVKASGLRWLSVMWLTEIAWAQRIIGGLSALKATGDAHHALTDGCRFV